MKDIKIHNDLNLLVSFAVAYVAENCELSEDSIIKLKSIVECQEEYLLSNTDDNGMEDSQVIDELMENIRNIQEKLEAFDDLEY